MSALPSSAPLRRPRAPGKVIAFPKPAPVALGGEDATETTAGWSLATEDYDRTPVPDGCHSCWLTGGSKCMSCPLQATPRARVVLS